MVVLGIESSCDDTAAAIVENGRVVLSSVVSSQDNIHARYGGVVPELASRRHIEMIVPVVDEALLKAGVTLDDIDAIAVTQGPGLVGSLLIGLSFAKSLSYVKGLPLTGVNHIESHPHAAFLVDRGEEKEAPSFPFVALIVSGGHTTLLYFEGYTKYSILDRRSTIRLARLLTGQLLGLGYPGGAVIDSLRKRAPGQLFRGRRQGQSRLQLQRPQDRCVTLSRHGGPLTGTALNDIAASFQEAVVDSLVTKGLWAMRATGAKNLVVAGGVASNSRFRAALAEAAETEGVRLFVPQPKYCTDNAAMVAALGTRQIEAGLVAGPDLNALPTWEGF
jgi:N6-L-threonylcarbamoyladenine synthase